MLAFDAEQHDKNVGEIAACDLAGDPISNVGNALQGLSEGAPSHNLGLRFVGGTVATVVRTRRAVPSEGRHCACLHPQVFTEGCRAACLDLRKPNLKS